MDILFWIITVLLGVSVYFNFELFSIARELKERLGAYGDDYISERVSSNN